MTEHWTPEPIKAWRMWRVDSAVLVLHSITANDYWHAGPMPAARHHRSGMLPSIDHSVVPAPRCGCGYYGLKPSLLDSPNDWGSLVWPAESVVHMGVLGWVNMWGAIEEHEHGYRAQYAQIDSIITFPLSWFFELDFPWLVSMPEYGDTLRRTRAEQYTTRAAGIAHHLKVPLVLHG